MEGKFLNLYLSCNKFILLLHLIHSLLDTQPKSDITFPQNFESIALLSSTIQCWVERSEASLILISYVTLVFCFFLFVSFVFSVEFTWLFSLSTMFWNFTMMCLSILFSSVFKALCEPILFGNSWPSVLGNYLKSLI